MNSLDSNDGSNFWDKLRPFNFESTVCDEEKIDEEPITSTSQGNKIKRDWKGNLDGISAENANSCLLIYGIFVSKTKSRMIYFNVKKFIWYWVDLVSSVVSSVLIHFQPMFHFYTPWKHQKTGGFLMFSGGIEVQHWLKIG